MPPSRLLGTLVVACLCSGSSSFSWNAASSNNRWAPSSHPASTGCRHLHPLRTAPTTVVVQSSPFGLGDDDEEDPADFLSEQERLKLERESDLTPEPIAVQSSPFGLADNDEEDPADFLSDLERLVPAPNPFPKRHRTKKRPVSAPGSQRRHGTSSKPSRGQMIIDNPESEVQSAIADILG